MTDQKQDKLRPSTGASVESDGRSSQSATLTEPEKTLPPRTEERRSQESGSGSSDSGVELTPEAGLLLADLEVESVRSSLCSKLVADEMDGGSGGSSVRTQASIVVIPLQIEPPASAVVKGPSVQEGKKEQPAPAPKPASPPAKAGPRFARYLLEEKGPAAPAAAPAATPPSGSPDATITWQPGSALLAQPASPADKACKGMDRAARGLTQVAKLLSLLSCAYQCYSTTSAAAREARYGKKSKK